MATIPDETKKSRKPEGVALSETSVQQNAAILQYYRTSISALSGATAGIMGLTGIWGFILYFITVTVLSMFILAKTGSQWNSFFMSRKVVFSSGLLGGLFTHVLFWTFLYGMVHVY